MNPYTKAAQFIIRLIAFAFILFGALELGAEYFAHRHHKAGGNAFWLFVEILSLLIGLVLLFKSGAIAKKLTEDFED